MLASIGDPLTGIADRLSDGRHTPISAGGSRRTTDLLIGATAFTPGVTLVGGAAHLMSPIAGRRATSTGRTDVTAFGGGTAPW
jgi:2-polyprenyl-6-methoxyphenol hydroxylase-like FAD-dependent oxidoreductase